MTAAEETVEQLALFTLDATPETPVGRVTQERQIATFQQLNETKRDLVGRWLQAAELEHEESGLYERFKAHIINTEYDAAQEMWPGFISRESGECAGGRYEAIKVSGVIFTRITLADFQDYQPHFNMTVDESYDVAKSILFRELVAPHSQPNHRCRAPYLGRTHVNLHHHVSWEPAHLAVNNANTLCMRPLGEDRPWHVGVEMIDDWGSDICKECRTAWKQMNAAWNRIKDL